jgi:hypothetical protein
MIGLCALAPAAVLAQAAPVPAPAQPVAPAAAPEAPPPQAPLSDGVKALLTLDYDGVSHDAITKSTSWPLMLTYEAWPYDNRKYIGDVYSYIGVTGAQGEARFTLTYDEVMVGQQHHFAIKLLMTRPALPEGTDCLLIRDLRHYVQASGWTGLQNYASMLTHGFTAQKGKLLIDARVDIGKGERKDVPLGLDDRGCVGAVTIKDNTPEKKAG